jgi:cobalamin biosynthesis Mg chelatase CobN
MHRKSAQTTAPSSPESAPGIIGRGFDALVDTVSDFARTRIFRLTLAAGSIGVGLWAATPGAEILASENGIEMSLPGGSDVAEAVCLNPNSPTTVVGGEVVCAPTRPTTPTTPKPVVTTTAPVVTTAKPVTSTIRTTPSTTEAVADTTVAESSTTEAPATTTTLSEAEISTRAKIETDKAAVAAAEAKAAADAKLAEIETARVAAINATPTTATTSAPSTTSVMATSTTLSESQKAEIAKAAADAALVQATTPTTAASQPKSKGETPVVPIVFGGLTFAALAALIVRRRRNTEETPDARNDLKGMKAPDDLRGIGVTVEKVGSAN